MFDRVIQQLGLKYFNCVFFCQWQAIYPDHFLNLNEGSSKWKPLNVILTVVPARENSGPFEVHAQVDLHVTASEHYPNM